MCASSGDHSLPISLCCYFGHLVRMRTSFHNVSWALFLCGTGPAMTLGGDCLVICSFSMDFSTATVAETGLWPLGWKFTRTEYITFTTCAESLWSLVFRSYLNRCKTHAQPKFCSYCLIDFRYLDLCRPFEWLSLCQLCVKSAISAVATLPCACGARCKQASQKGRADSLSLRAYWFPFQRLSTVAFSFVRLCDSPL